MKYPFKWLWMIMRSENGTWLRYLSYYERVHQADKNLGLNWVFSMNSMWYINIKKEDKGIKKISISKICKWNLFASQDVCLWNFNILDLKRLRGCRCNARSIKIICIGGGVGVEWGLRLILKLIYNLSKQNLSDKWK